MGVCLCRGVYVCFCGCSLLVLRRGWLGRGSPSQAGRGGLKAGLLTGVGGARIGQPEDPKKNRITNRKQKKEKEKKRTGNTGGKQQQVQPGFRV